MKILCNYTPCGPHYVRSGWGRVFRALGHNFLFWNPQTKSAFDVFSEFEPDVYIGTTYELDRAVYKNVASRPHMRVALYASAWGPYLDGVDPTKYPVVVAGEQEKATVERLKKETGRPDFVFIHAHGHWLEGTMSGWAATGVPYLGVLNAADTFLYLNPPRRPELACDVGFVGGYWGYKARNLDRFLLPLCHPSSGLSVKVFGNQPWPVHQYLGRVDDFTAASLFPSAAVCPNVSEPHSTDLGWDVIERPFKVLCAGGVCVSDYVAEARDLFAEGELPMAKTPREFEDLVRTAVDFPETSARLAAEGRKKVLAEHTYWDRVAQLWTGLGMADEAARTLAMKQRVLDLAENQLCSKP